MYALLQFIYLPSSVCGIINVMQLRFRESASMKPESASEKSVIGRREYGDFREW